MRAALDALHERVVFSRRIDRLATLFAERLPPGASVLDVGAGDGQLAALILRRRPDLSIRGVDVLARARTAIPVEIYDGGRLPLPDAGVDVVMCVDVLHHAGNPAGVLRECARVARSLVVIKDHLREGFLARATLRFMDMVGNARFGVALPYNYLSREEWRAAIAAAHLRITRWDEKLELYGPPADWVFGRNLHVLAMLATAGG